MSWVPSPPDPLAELSFGERAAIGRIEKALFGGDARLVRVGRYEIAALIGSGAFGKVYRAHDPELSRDVALKVMEAIGAADRDELLREARVMATISHPNVAAVHDAGVIDEAGRVRVFIAMELVAGANLRDWLSAGRTRAAIVEVMRQAGRGLAAAHAAGIVHRDFKPDNVLVGDDGRARVVDFGLAYAHDGGAEHDELPADRPVTASVIGTPAYMAPEQLAGAPASARSDQFAYGVTFWEAAYGARPFAGATLGALRGALDQPPRAPRRRWSRTVHRALERSLARDPDRRFASIEAMLTAIDRRRARWLAAASAAIAGLAIGAAVVSQLRAPSATDPCPRPTAELAGIWDAPGKATIGAAFATAGPRGDAAFARVAPALDRLTDSWLTARRDACEATAVHHAQSPELLDRRVACLHDWRRQLAALTGAFARATPAIVASAPQAIGELPALARCASPDELIAIPARSRDPALRARLDALDDQLAEVRALHIAGRQAEASALADQVAQAADAVGDAPVAIAAALWQAEVRTVAGKLDDARAMARRAFDLALAISDRRSAAMAAADVAFVGAYDPTRTADSLQWVHTGQALVAKLDGALELDAKLANAEGNIEVAAGVPAAAEAAIARAVADFRKLDPDHINLGSSLGVLGSAELDQGKIAAAERDLRESARRIERDLGADHPELASSWINLALVEVARGFYGDAIRTLDRALALQRRVLGADHPNLAYAYLTRGGARAAQGDLAAADRDFVEADRIVRAGYGASHPLVGTIAMADAEVLVGLGRGAEAVRKASFARAIFGTTDALSAGLAEATLARALAADGHPRDALELARAAAARADKVPTGPAAVRGMIFQALGDLLLAQRQPAGSALEAAVTALSAGAPDPMRLAQARFALARATAAHTAAVTPARAALAGFPRDGDPAIRAAITAWLARHSP